MLYLFIQALQIYFIILYILFLYVAFQNLTEHQRRKLQTKLNYRYHHKTLDKILSQTESSNPIKD